jgi:hypothetical protein
VLVHPHPGLEPVEVGSGCDDLPQQRRVQRHPVLEALGRAKRAAGSACQPGEVVHEPLRSRLDDVDNPSAQRPRPRRLVTQVLELRPASRVGER